MARAREAVQEQQHRGILLPGFAVEDLFVVDCHRVKGGFGHVRNLLLAAEHSTVSSQGAHNDLFQSHEEPVFPHRIYAYDSQMSELSNMRLFVRVVEEGSFSAAARFLGVTPSSVSRQVSQLEHELGARLFHRTTRKQSLTEPGEIYFQHAHRIVADLEAARLAVGRFTDTPSGSLHITVEADFALAYVGADPARFPRPLPRGAGSPFYECRHDGSRGQWNRSRDSHRPSRGLQPNRP